MRKMRRDMQMIFQDPYGSIDPRWTIGEVIAEPLKTHFKRQSSKEVESKVKELLQLVGLNPEWVSRYPHEFSVDSVSALESQGQLRLILLLYLRMKLFLHWMCPFKLRLLTY